MCVCVSVCVCACAHVFTRIHSLSLSLYVYMICMHNIQKLFDPPNMVSNGLYFDSTPCLDIDTVRKAPPPPPVTLSPPPVTPPPHCQASSPLLASSFLIRSRYARLCASHAPKLSPGLVKMVKSMPVCHTLQAGKPRMNPFVSHALRTTAVYTVPSSTHIHRCTLGHT